MADRLELRSGRADGLCRRDGIAQSKPLCRGIVAAYLTLWPSHNKLAVSGFTRRRVASDSKPSGHSRRSAADAGVSARRSPMTTPQRRTIVGMSLLKCFHWIDEASLKLQRVWIWVFVLLAATAAHCHGQKLALHDGDRVVFYGDSITAQRLYTRFFEDFMLTRYPQTHVSFWNAGVPGDTVYGGYTGDVPTRLKRDVLSHRP